ncbi:hypothetical protein CkaCkLH20_12305 [Colletotrichum karsti]|uniref:NWD NACHT-NTPase N-terminal domain-containing protein n=1 Tax=Colletotrichum karsti TaxID=1095194 RepID=A0A9P6HU15_9PEZI|nr:uncharacterized protein CkaCkLH20_12305 [Colletotrichum karsti]KAF9870219.1 hypothetical protein CkaCkLH20_12305 [Colletotrichum karsti]
MSRSAIKDKGRRFFGRILPRKVEPAPSKPDEQPEVDPRQNLRISDDEVGSSSASTSIRENDNHVDPEAQDASQAHQPSLWDKAYARLVEEDSKLVGDYDELLSKEMERQTREDSKPDSPAEDNSHTLATESAYARRQKLEEMARKGLDHLDGKRVAYQVFGHEFTPSARIAQAAELLQWAKTFIDKAIQASPEASLAWAGVSLVFPLLINPVNADQEHRDGFAYVTTRMHYYAELDRPIRSLWNRVDDTALVGAAEEHLVGLYQLFLGFQLRSVLRFYRNQFKTYLRDSIEHDNWKSLLEEIKGQERSVDEVVANLNNLRMGQDLEMLRQYTQQSLDQSTRLLATADKHLEISEKSLDVASRQLQLTLSAKENECHQLFRLATPGIEEPYEWYKGRIQDRVEGTCQWFLKHQSYRRWIAQDSGLLLVTANPGCGKSVLAKYLVDDILPNSASPPPLVCYFFFKDQDQNTVAKALCAVLHQLFTLRPDLIRHAIPEYDKNGKRLVGISSSLWKILSDATGQLGSERVVIVLDALDECEESQLKDLLRDQETDNNVKWLMTSRPYDSITSQFYGQANSFSIHIPGENESDALAEEINLVIEHRVSKLAKRRIGGNRTFLNDELKNHLLDTVLQMEHRTYLWLDLVFEDLEKRNLKKTKGGIDSAVLSLPSTVNEAYERILSKSTDPATTEKVLCMIVAAGRPLSVSEMNYAVNADTVENVDDLELESDEDFQDRLRSLCGLFVSIHEDKVYLLHQTAKEFLLEGDDTIQSQQLTTRAIQGVPQSHENTNRVWKNSISRNAAHRMAFEACFASLNQTTTESSHTHCHPQEGGRELFWDYAINNWPTHLMQSGAIAEIDTFLKVLYFVQQNFRAAGSIKGSFLRNFGGRRIFKYLCRPIYGKYCPKVAAQLELMKGSNRL